MGRRKWKNKVKTGAKSPTIVLVHQNPSTGTGERTALPPGMGKLRPDRTVLATKEVLIMAPVEFCFGLLVKQLEQKPQWDPIVVDARPVSSIRCRIGATSEVALNLAGRKLMCPAVICRYRSNRAISWVLASEPKVREDWSLEPKGNGTLVRVRLAYEASGWIIGRLLYELTGWKRVELALDTTLNLLKAHAERNYLR